MKRIPQLKDFHKIKALLTSQEFIASVVFAFGLALFEALLLKVNYAKYLTYFRHGDYVLFTGASVIILASLVWLVLFLWSSLTASHPLKLAYWFVFSLIVLMQYGYQSALGRFANLDDLSLAVFATDFDIKRNMTLAYFRWIALIPGIAYAFLLLHRSRISKTGWKTFLVVVFLAFCLYTPTARSGYTDLRLHRFYDGLGECVFSHSDGERLALEICFPGAERGHRFQINRAAQKQYRLDS